MKTRLMLLSLALLAALAFVWRADGATITVTTAANWSALTGGSGAGGQPNTSDTVVVRNSVTLTVDTSSATCGALQLGGQGATGAGTLHFSGTAPALVVSGNVLLGGYGNANRRGTITFTSGSTLTAGSLTLGNAGTTPGLGTITMTAGGTLSVGGAITVNTVTGNTWTPGTGTVVLTANNTLPATIFTTFNNLTINGGNATLGVTLAINGTLTLTSGVITTGSYQVNVANTSNSAISGGSTSSYINGSLQKAFATGSGQAFTFPIGDAANYTPINFASFNVTTAGNVTAKTTSGQHLNIATSGIDSTKDVNRYYTLTAAGGLVVGANTVTFNFVAGDVMGGANTASFVVQRYSGGWNTTTIGTRNPTSTQITGLTSFGDFAIGDQASTTTLASSQNPSLYGQSVTLTATVSAGVSGTPSGTVTFKDGATSLGTGTLSSGKAALTTSALAVGQHPITAAYSGDSTYSASTSSVLNQIVTLATGGAITFAGGNTIHAFTSGGTFTVPAGASGSVEVLVVAGGGGGASSTDRTGGGGGAGGLLHTNSYLVAAGTYTVTIGAGGAANANGGNSSFGTDPNLVAIGGGRGGQSPTTGQTPGNGGSGGGANHFNNPGPNSGYPPGTGTPGQGNSGGAGYDSKIVGDTFAGGGGGGAGAVGANGTTNAAGAGGAGLSYSISGSAVYYAGGGGGGAQYAPGGAGGSGGGGAGATGTTTAVAGTAGTANTGGGGGGGSTAGAGGAGGSGIVIISYQNPVSTYTTVASSVNPSIHGQAVSFTANVSPGSGGPPTGTMQFQVDGVNLGSPVALSGGTATSAATSTMAAGNHTVTAIYSGDSTFAASTGTLSGGQTVNAFGSATAYRIADAASGSPSPGAADQLTIRLVDQYGNTVTTFTGDKSLTFSGLGTAGDGTYPTVTDKNGSAVNLGTGEAITFAGGTSSSANSAAVLMAYKAQTNVTLNVTDSGGLSSTSAGGAGLVLTIPNSGPVVLPRNYTRAPGLSLKILKSDLLAGATDANHDTLSLSAVQNPSTGGATVTAPAGSWVFYLPGAAGNGDTFTYTVSDTSGATASGTVTVYTVKQGGQAQQISYSSGGVTVLFAGIPGYAYDVQRSATVSFSSFTNLTPNGITAPSAGVFSYTDPNPPNPGPSFYRLMQH